MPLGDSGHLGESGPLGDLMLEFEFGALGDLMLEFECGPLVLRPLMFGLIFSGSESESPLFIVLDLSGPVSFEGYLVVS